MEYLRVFCHVGFFLFLSTREMFDHQEEAAGALTGNDKLREEGKTDQAVGKTKQAVQKAADTVKKAVKKVIG